MQRLTLRFAAATVNLASLRNVARCFGTIVLHLPGSGHIESWTLPRDLTAVEVQVHYYTPPTATEDTIRKMLNDLQVYVDAGYHLSVYVPLAVYASLTGPDQHTGIDLLPLDLTTQST